MKEPYIFISYARKDGEAYSAWLRKELIPHFGKEALWRDRDRMEGGLDWWNQIRAALDQVEYMVLIATPAAMQSETVKREWRYARSQGVCVYPVQVPDLPIDFNSLPKWMKDAHFYDLDKEWDNFIEKLKNSCENPRVPFTTPSNLGSYVPRPDEINALIGKILDEKRENPLQSKVALRGAGGFGKTTIATALCHDDAVYAAFDDGILWTTLGEQPDILQALTECYSYLTAERPNFVSIPEASHALAEKLSEKDYLWIIDDVWNPDHLRPILNIAQSITLVITSRSTEVTRLLTNYSFDGVRPTQTATILIEEMQDEQAIELVGFALPKTDNELLLRLARRLGKWPLLLEIANAILRERVQEFGSGVKQAIEWLNNGLDEEGISILETDDENERKRSAYGVLSASFRLLNEEETRLLRELSIFREDTDVPETSVRQLWSKTATQTQILLSKFARLSFLRYDAGLGTIRFHDILREVLYSQLEQVELVHQRLLECWQLNTKPYRLPDVYAWQHSAYHLLKAKHADKLLELLTQDRSWLDSKFQATGSDLSYLNDLLLMQQSFSEPLDATAVRNLANLYTARQLILERTGNITETELQILVWLNQTDRALNYVHQRPEKHKLIDGLRSIHSAKKHLGETNSEYLMLAVPLLNAIPEISNRLRAILNLGHEFFDIGEFNQAQTMLDRALPLIEQISENQEFLEPWLRQRICVLCVKLKRFGDADHILANLHNFEFRVDALIKMARQYAAMELPDRIESCLEEALQISLAYSRDKYQRAAALIKIMEFLIEFGINEKLEDTLSELKKTAYALAESNYAAPLFGLISLAVFLYKTGNLGEFEETLKAMSESSYDGKMLSVAEVYVKTGQIEELLNLAKKLPDDEFYSDYSLRAISKWLSEQGYLAEAEEFAAKIKNEHYQREPQNWLAYHYARAGNLKKAQSALAAMKAAMGRDNEDRDKSNVVIRCLRSFLGSSQIDQALVLAFHIQRPIEHIRALYEIAVYCYLLNVPFERDLIIEVAESWLNAISNSEKAHALASKAWMFLKTERFAEYEALVEELDFDNVSHLKIARLEDLARTDLQVAQQVFEQTLWGHRSSACVEANCILAVSFHNIANLQSRDGYFEAAEKFAAYLLDEPLMSTRSEAFNLILEAYLSVSLFDKAENLLPFIDEPLRSYALKSLCNALVDDGQFQRASDLALNISLPQAKCEALAIIAMFYDHAHDSLNAARFWQDAEAIAESIYVEKERKETFQRLATIYAVAGQFTKAFAHLPNLEFDKYIEILANWGRYFHAVDETLASTVLKDAFRIAAWSETGWKAINIQINGEGQ